MVLRSTNNFELLSKLTMAFTQNPPLPTIALPGQPLGLSTLYKPGSGTHLPVTHSSVIHASILGPVLTIPTKKGLSTVSVIRQSQTTAETSLLPKEGNVILGRVTRINIREARVQILVINDVPVMEEFAGVIRYLSSQICAAKFIDFQSSGCSRDRKG